MWYVVCRENEIDLSLAEPHPDAHGHEEQGRGAVEVEGRDEAGDGFAHGHAEQGDHGQGQDRSEEDGGRLF